MLSYSSTNRPVTEEHGYTDVAPRHVHSFIARGEHSHIYIEDPTPLTQTIRSRSGGCPATHHRLP